MKAIRGKIIVKSFANQKETFLITGEGGRQIELWMGRQYDQNNRRKNPVVCEVIDNNSKYDYIKKGDFILVHHNLLSDWKTNPFCLEYDVQTGIGIYSFAVSETVYCILNNDGTVLPVCENIIAKRIQNKNISSVLIIPDSVKQEYDDRVEVVAVAPEVEGLAPGDIVAIQKMADYEICYSWQKNDYSVIKVWKEDIVGVLA